ncbi:glycosyl hydrolase family 28-related protein [Pseudokineococcus basanitobsidens]|uniref:Glycosyl hydrolase family 28-related protein n=1 Tax=Pseudokineococcus basanitobsidens TaxID=1926649 RepID=A0ABU8RJT3_9ACTN
MATSSAAAHHPRRNRSLVVVLGLGLGLGLLPQGLVPPLVPTAAAADAGAVATTPAVGSGYSLTAGGRKLFGSTQPAGVVDVVVTSPQRITAVRLADARSRTLTSTTAVGRDSLGQHVAALRVDLAALAGSSTKLVAHLTYPSGSTHRLEATFRVAAAPVAAPTPAPAATAAPAPIPTPATPTPAPTPPTPAVPTQTPTPTPTPTGAPAPAVPVTSAVSGTPLTAFGAVGDGVTDDTAAIQRAFDTARAGTTLVVPAGKIFRHTDVLRLKRPDLTLAGTGTLRATREEKSSLLVSGDRTTVRDVTLELVGSTRRIGTWEDMKLTVLGAKDVTLERVRVRGSAGAGVYFWGAERFTATDLSVSGTRADGIHVTGPSSDGTITRPVVTGSGDDGVAVVSYAQDGQPVRRVTVTSPTVLGTTWGRGVTVVGGEDITYSDIRVERSNAAAVYIAKEPGWRTFAPVRVRVVGGTVVDANQSRTVDHGAVLVWDGWVAGPGQMRDVVVEGLSITGTRSSASRQVGFLRGLGSTATGVHLNRFSITGGPTNLLVAQAPPGDYEAKGWVVDGRAVCVER